MRIRKRPADVLRHAQEAPVSSAQTCSAAAAPAPAPCSETVAARRLEPPTGEVDLTTPMAAALDPRRVSSGQNRQKEGKEKGDGAPQDEKRGEDDGRAEREDKPPVNVVGSAPAVPKREEEDRSTAVETEKKSGDSGRRVMEHGEEKITEAAALCKKGDGKGWHCKRAARCGYSLCQYHHDKLRSYACNSQKKKKKQQQQKKKPKDASDNSTSAGVRHRQEASEKEKNNQKRRRVEADVVLGTGLDMSPDSFYYYSGFGPRWGRKRRGGRSVEGAVGVPDGGAPQVQLHQDDAGDGTAAAAAVAGREEDDGDGCDASSRDGKPWKSRALSSLL